MIVNIHGASLLLSQTMLFTSGLLEQKEKCLTVAGNSLTLSQMNHSYMAISSTIVL